MVKIKQDILDQIIFQAQSEAPLEACGYLAGTAEIITQAYPLRNADQSPEHFSFAPEDQFRVTKEIRQKNMKVWGNYHSHPQSPARPSTEDIRLAHDSNIYYFIVSLSELPLVRAFRIAAGVETEEPVEDIT
jgi:proteasome lid subunit RPN8/RPN11